MESSLVIFDARNIVGGPIASITLPSRVPYGFHGKFFSTAEIGMNYYAKYSYCYGCVNLAIVLLMLIYV